MLPELEAIDASMLVNVVRQDQRSPDFEITTWSVSKLSDQGAINPDGLFRFNGAGHDPQGTRPWSVVLKVIRDMGYGNDPGFNLNRFDEACRLADRLTYSVSPKLPDTSGGRPDVNVWTGSDARKTVGFLKLASRSAPSEAYGAASVVM